MVDGNDSFNLNRINHVNRDRIAVGKTASGCLLNIDSVINSVNIVGKVTRDILENTGSTVFNTGSGPRTNSTIGVVDSVFPVSNQVIHVPVAEVSGSGDFTIDTNLRIVNCHNNLRILTNIDVVRLALHAATLRSGHHNGEDVRIILCRQRSGNESIVTIHNPNRIAFHEARKIRYCNLSRRNEPITRNCHLVTTNSIVVKSPLVGVIQRSIRIVQVSIERNQIVVTNHRVASDLDGGLHHNMDEFRSGSDLGNTTVFADTLDGEGIDTLFVEVDDNSMLIQTGDFNAILIPNVRSSIAISVENNLTAFADRIVADIEIDRSGQLMNDDVDTASHLTTSVVTGRRGSNHVSVVIERRDSRNGRTVERIHTSAGPSVNDVIIGETVEVSIQDNHLAFANFHLVGVDLQISTVGVDVEGLDRSTSTVGSRHRVNTSGGGVEGSTRRTIAPSISVGLVSVRSSGNRSGSTVTDDVVAREREVRSSVNRHLCSSKRVDIN